VPSMLGPSYRWQLTESKTERGSCKGLVGEDTVQTCNLAGVIRKRCPVTRDQNGLK
jgi:hypothetical protein